MARNLIEERSEGRILYWTLHRPERANALTPEMLAWMESRAQSLDGELVLLSSSQTRCFSAGFDLQALATRVRALNANRGPVVALPDDPLASCTRALLRAKACLVGLVDAPVIGAGVELLSHFDYLHLTPKASFRIPARRLGVLYHAAGLAQLRHRFGDAALFEMLVQGGTVSAESLAQRPRFSLHKDRPSLDESLKTWKTQLLDQSAQTLGRHCALLRGPDFDLSPEERSAYDAARAQAYRDPALEQAIDKAIAKT